MEEIEVKFLNIDRERLEEKLRSIGAMKQGDYFYKRRVFDYPDLRLNAKGAWLRLRDEGNRVTLSYKQRLGIAAHDGSASDQSMEEVEVEVSDFANTTLLLLRLGFIEKFYQENKRTRWVHDGVEFDIDTWPKLQPYLEIEAPTWKKIDEAIRLLELNPDDKKIFSTHQVYKLNDIDELDYIHMGFDKFIKRSRAHKD